MFRSFPQASNWIEILSAQSRRAIRLHFGGSQHQITTRATLFTLPNIARLTSLRPRLLESSFDGQSEVHYCCWHIPFMAEIPWTSQLDHIGRRLFIATHRRSGTHLTIDLLRKQFREFKSWKKLGQSASQLYLTLEHLNRAGLIGKAPTRRSLTIEHSFEILRRPPRPIIKTHSLPGFEQWTGELHDFVDQLLLDADIMYVYRDGRSVLTSQHLYMQHFHPEARCPIGQFIRQEINGINHVQAWDAHVRQWLDHPGVYTLKFEEVIKNTREVLQQLGSFLHADPLFVEPLLPRRLRSIWESRWLRLTSRRPEPSTILSDGYNRKQKVNWRQDFTRDDRAFFHEHAGDLLIELGYEKSDAWIDQAPAVSSSKAVT